MRTIALTTTAALAALMLATPTFTPPAEAAKVRVNGVKVKPRIRVRPQIKVRINKKRLIRKAATPANQRQQVPEGKQPQNRTTTITTSPGKTPAQRFSTIDPYGSVADAVQDAMERFGAGDLGNFDAEDIIGLDRFVVGLGLGGDVLGGDEDNANDTLAGLRPPGGGGSMFDPNDILPGNDNQPDTSHVAVTPGSIDAARNGVASGKDDVNVTRRDPNGPGGTAYARGEDDDGNKYETWYTLITPGNGESQAETTRPDGTRVLFHDRYDRENGTDSTVTVDTGSGEVEAEGPGTGATRTRGQPEEGDSNNTGTTELRNPDAPGGGEVIPVNCGSVACNEARKGKGLRLTGNPTTHVLPADPAEDTGGTVGNAPYTGKYWRDVATTNPGSDPQDPGDGQPVQTSKTQVLIIDDGTGPKPPSVPGN